MAPGHQVSQFCPLFVRSGGVQPQPVLSDRGGRRHRRLRQSHAAHLLPELPPVPHPRHQAPAHLHHRQVSSRRRWKRSPAVNHPLSQAVSRQQSLIDIQSGCDFLLRMEERVSRWKRGRRFYFLISITKTAGEDLRLEIDRKHFSITAFKPTGSSTK